MLENLSKRQFQITELRIWAGSNKGVAATLGISTKTVENHITEICRKLEIEASELNAIYLEEVCGAKRPEMVCIRATSVARRIREFCSAVIVAAILTAQFSDGFNAQRVFRTPRRVTQVARASRARELIFDL